MATYQMSWVKYLYSRKATYSDIETVRQLEKRGVTDSFIQAPATMIRRVNLTGTDEEIKDKRNRVAEALKATYKGRGYRWDIIE